MVSCLPLCSRSWPRPHISGKALEGILFLLLKIWEIVKFSLLDSLVTNFNYFLTGGGCTDFVNIYTVKRRYKENSVEPVSPFSS